MCAYLACVANVGAFRRTFISSLQHLWHTRSVQWIFEADNMISEIQHKHHVIPTQNVLLGGFHHTLNCMTIRNAICMCYSTPPPPHPSTSATPALPFTSHTHTHTHSPRPPHSTTHTHIHTLTHARMHHLTHTHTHTLSSRFGGHRERGGGGGVRRRQQQPSTPPESTRTRIVLCCVRAKTERVLLYLRSSSTDVMRL